MKASLVATAFGGVLLACAFPPIQFGFAAWIALVPLFWVIQREDRLAWITLYGFVFGVVFFFIDVNWVYRTLVMHGHFETVTAVLIFLGMVLTLSLFPGVVCLVLGLFKSHGIKFSMAAPFVWTGMEYVRAVILTGFPWDLVGYSQTDRSLLVQVADITGVYGVSFLIVLVNASIWELLHAWARKDPLPWRLLGICGLSLALVLSYGSIRLKHFPPRTQAEGGFPIGILQGNIPQEVKWERAAREHTFLVYKGLGRKAVHQGAHLLVWPETSVPVLFGGDDPDWMRAARISSQLGVPMLVGAPSLRSDQTGTRYYNSAFLVDGGAALFRYDKIHLVPFGEYMPLSWLLPVGPGIAAREADYSAGDTMTVMRVHQCPPFSVLICYEAIFPELARMALDRGARMLINLTNDAWFGDTAAPYQHLAMARMRSIENRVWFLRAANTGVSAAFDPAGRVVGEIPLQEPGVLIIRVPHSAAAGSFYSRFGDVFVWGCIGICLLLGLIPGRSRLRH